MHKIQISIVVPTYRRPVLLHHCIRALAEQHLEKNTYELLVISDGPDEASRQKVEYWFEKNQLNIRYISLPFKKGPAAARNAGWKNARGSLIAFTDDDCLPHPGWLAAILENYRHEDEIAFTGRIIVPLPDHPTDFERNTQGLEKARFVTANCACTRKALERVNGFDEAFNMAWREDSDLEFKLLQNQVSIRQVDSAIVVHPSRKAPWGISLKDQKKGMFNALLYKKYPDLYRQLIGQRPPWNYYAMICCLLALIFSLLFKWDWLSVAAFIAWLALVASFVLKRLSNTSRSLNHVAEMVLTSILIPFLSVFWQLYGSWKYRVLFL